MIYKYLKHISCVALFSVFHMVVAPTLLVTLAYAEEPVFPESGDHLSLDVNDLIQNPTLPKDVGLDANGYPVDAGRGFTPAQTNMLLGKSVIMTAVECVQKYGQYFCECATLDNGLEACYHRTPAAGYYDLKVCEEIWGKGQCDCAKAGGKDCYKKSEDRNPTTTSCLDQVFFFPGEKMECRNSGVLTIGKECCESKGEMDKACSFENVASELGLGDFAMVALSLGSMMNQATGILGTSLQDMASQYLAKQLVEAWVKDGAVGIMGDMLNYLGSDVTNEVVQTMISEATKAGVETMGTGLATEAVTAVASTISSVISVAGWIYTAYQIYNMIQAMRQCNAGEMILGCKRAKKICHRVGRRCKVKVLDICLQHVTSYCCFNSQLSRIIHEQGRPQLGLGWGSGKKPICRGFYPNEFVQLNFASMDLSEYANEITKQMSVKFTEKAEEAAKRAMENFSF